MHPLLERQFSLTGKVALVTGGSKGLGKAMARGLAAAGADLVLAARHEEQLQRTADELRRETGRTVHVVTADLSRREQTERLAEEALRAAGRIDILVNNAGTNVPQPIQAIDNQTWDQIVELNLSSIMALSRALAPGMIERRWGRIIHISSIMGFISAPGRDVYSATKSGLLGLTRAMAIDLGPHGITVNCIAPGPFLTDLPMSLLSKEQQEEFAKRTALGRWGRPDELIGTVVLLASEAGCYITGTTIVVDGGWLAK